jgi:hypothetical protein
VHRVFLFVIWIVNGYLFYLTLYRVDRHLRLLATSLFLVSAFILQSYALHTEIFILTAFLVGMLAIIRAHPGAEFVLGLSASAALFVKLIGPIAFIPCVYYAILAVPRGACPPTRERRLALFLAGAVAPAVGVAAYLAWYGTGAEFWQQVVLDTSHLGLSINDDWLGYFTLAVAPLLVPVFVALILLDRRPADLEWWLTALVFVGLLAVELVRGARHYGLFNLCVLAWMAVRAQDALNWRNHVQRTGLCLLLALAAIVQVGAVREILTRGWITNELSAARFAESLPRGSLQVFANNPPRLYMLLNDLSPAYAYVFIYDTNNELLIWDSYRDMIDKSPPDYIAVEDNFAAIEYGQLRSAELTDATAVKTWLEYRGDYRQLDVGRALHVTMYQREFPSANFP